jgi:DNA-binding NarL/FixJ family response regulator
MQHKNIRIVLIEDDPTICEAYTYLINESTGFGIIDAYPTAEIALKKFRTVIPDLILLDIGLPGMSGIDAISRIKLMLPEVPIVILTVYESESMIFDALSYGASGYLTKNCSPAKILEAIREVTTGGGSMTSNVTRVVFDSFRRTENSPLSTRETRIMENIANGMNRGQIAGSLFISGETVKSHIKNIYRKLKVHSKSDAINTAKKQKII